MPNWKFKYSKDEVDISMLKYNPLMYIHLPTYADQIKPRLQTKPSGPSDKKPKTPTPENQSQ
jgi:hypothetical protein